VPASRDRADDAVTGWSGGTRRALVPGAQTGRVMPTSTEPSLSRRSSTTPRPISREQAATDAVLAEHPDPGERVAEDGIAVRERGVHRIEESARHCGTPICCASAPTAE
jgi:hypothetical protein